MVLEYVPLLVQPLLVMPHSHALSRSYENLKLRNHAPFDFYLELGTFKIVQI